MEITDSFRAYFDADSLEDFERDPSVIYGLAAEGLTLALLNDAWFAIARATGAPPDFFDRFGLGGSYLESLPEPIEPFFRSHILQSIDACEPWAFDYQCPTPERFRMFRMQVLPLPEHAGCVVTNAPIVDLPRPEDGRGAFEDILAAYVDPAGMLTQCSNCRRTRRTDEPSRWDWVPQLVWQEITPVSHSICPPCHAYFYPARHR